MSQRYNRSKVRRMIESLAVVYDIPVERWFVTFGTAMVMHELNASTDDIDITLGEEDWAKLQALHDCDSDALGPIIRLPGKVEIRSVSSLMVPHDWIKRHGVMSASMLSLNNSYNWLISNSVKGREKTNSDFANLNKTAEQLLLVSTQEVAEKSVLVKRVTQSVIDLVVDMNSSGIFDKIGEDVYRTQVKDLANNRWGVKVFPGSQSIEIWEVNEVDMHGNADIYSIRLTKKFDRVS